MENEFLLTSGANNLWLPVTSPDWSPAGLKQILQLPDEEVLPRVKARLLYTAAVPSIRRSLNKVSPEAIGKLDQVIGIMAGYLTKNPAAFAAMLSVTQHDSSPYTHAINVTIYALGLAVYLGMRDLEELRGLGLGAALCDIGQMSLARNLLNKRRELDPEEWEMIREHPEKGSEMLRAIGGLPDDVLMIVEQHHERNDGSGYPKGLTESELHPLTKIVSLVDSYDAMTSARPYRPQRTAYNALQELKREVGGRYSLEFFTNLLTILANPSEVGTSVSSK